ncbi:MAG: ABC transporter permease subunit [Phycisphaeraceae bacterium]|nr:MAG: ABC transporter permease subunit [Phycisphaeraceae bacterium]
MPVILRWLLRLGPMNPIAVRLVKNGSRRTRHLYIRSAYLGVLIFVLLWSLLLIGTGTLGYGELAQRGAASFTWIAYLQIGLICVLAPVFMAGAIAQEANPKTWEIMLTTPMSSLQIVLGNLVGRLFFILALLAASLPLFALTQYFGGVPGTAIFTSYLIAGCAAVIVGAVAVALAVSRLAGKKAVFAFYIGVVSYLAVTAGIDAFLRSPAQKAGMGPNGEGVTWMTGLNPFLSLRALLNPSTYPRAEPGTFRGVAAWSLETPVTAWCVGSLAVSLVLVLVSTITVRAGGLGALAGESGGVPWYRRMLGLGGAGAEHRPPREVWHNPVAWREAAARNATLGRIAARWSFIAAGLLFGVGLVAWYHTGRLTHESFRLALITTLWAEIAVVALVAINMSATAISREREDGTLDLLLTTSLTPSHYLFGKLRGLVAYLLPMLAVPIVTLGLASAYVALDGLDRQGGVIVNPASATPITPTAPAPAGPRPLAVGPPEPVVLPEAAILLPLVAVPFIGWCVMIGLHWSLGSRGTLSSVVGTVGVVGVLAGIVGLCGYKAAEGLQTIGPSLSAMSPATLLFSTIYPVEAMKETALSSGGLDAARISLAVGAIVASIVYTLVTLGVQASMVRGFDVTVRRLAGVR